ncbi:surfeit locus 1 family protein [Rhizomicrobium palustre]|uniref:SURF1-like protein n=1 Tax=Rhizomicrobium palustre TaxID=189966 RepID=A0A846N0X2_9PROT|nr:SURF1 family protein [Rhizomicrobium palustre]NIK89356.1 surfeit locus 1 family protein [Rhizomicrobium palustre]
MQFRPLPLFSLASLVMLAALVGLGHWQMQRLAWKEALIAQVNRNLTAPPLTLAEALRLGKAAEYRRVTVSGSFDHGKEAYVYGTADGAPVLHVITPLRTKTGTLLVDRGIVTLQMRDPARRQAGQVTGEVHATGLWRYPDPPGLFTPKPDLAKRLWFSRDVTAMAAGTKLVAPVLVEADASPNPGGWPKGGHSVVNFPNRHLEYALTWYGLALALVGVYIALHISKGRLRFR